jgi:hypothetical protein
MAIAIQALSELELVSEYAEWTIVVCSTANMQDESQITPADQPLSVQHAVTEPSPDADNPVVDPRLDLTSPEFDAQLALQTPDVQLPVPDALVLDNVSKFTKIVQSAEEPQRQDESNQQADPDAAREVRSGRTGTGPSSTQMHACAHPTAWPDSCVFECNRACIQQHASL